MTGHRFTAIFMSVNYLVVAACVSAVMFTAISQTV